ncbi:ketopantoate reductase family protein [Spiribacter halobius]|uniref:2-dehydropantoate 2-reductase n=1 Tax=Sediminicurvatus halobius TaxID=2182432 RepID=A0A2U2MWM2_9GAMM|nr:2-dehydropantoate 2-reductase [Spiribacter halobius]PWG61255.1 2-dehydropantoate 2-reductase [Spiribacter halobius]UEX78444.1 2-dehydropantoate 2-reductase [Spiribacter halobius]
MAAPRIAILGAGSLGLLFGASLAASGQSVHLLRRPGHRPTEERIRLERGGERRELSLPASGIDSPPPDLSHVILCTKAHDAAPAIRQLAPALPPGAAVLTLQNGLGSQDAVAAALPGHPVSAGCTTEGAWRRDARTVVHAGIGVTRIGPLQGDDVDWCQRLGPAGLGCEPVPDIRRWLVDKLRVNALLNPLTVLHDCRNGGVLEIPGARAALESLGAEADAVLAAAGYRFAEGAAARTAAVARATADNVSSMLQDYRAGRRLELDAITGAILTLGARHGIATPEHQRIYDTLRGLAAVGR